VLWAAGQSSAAYTNLADVFTAGNQGLAVGSARYQMSLSVSQFSIPGRATGGPYTNESGYQATTAALDSDNDGIPDSFDGDSDNDGTPDSADSRPYDWDGDGVNNVVDEDDDNDGLIDELEQLGGTSWLNVNTDGDPHNDYEEWITGNDGTDAADHFAVTNVTEFSPDGATIKWWASQGRTYTVLATNGLDQVGEWEEVGSTTAVAAGDMELSDPSPHSRRFYRVDVSM